MHFSLQCPLLLIGLFLNLLFLLLFVGKDSLELLLVSISGHLQLLVGFLLLTQLLLGLSKAALTPLHLQQLRHEFLFNLLSSLLATLQLGVHPLQVRLKRFDLLYGLNLHSLYADANHALAAHLDQSLHPRLAHNLDVFFKRLPCMLQQL